MSTRDLADKAREIEGAIERMANGLRGEGPDADADPAVLKLAIAIMAGALGEWLTQALEVATLEHRFAAEWRTLNKATMSAIKALTTQPVPLHARDANHAVYVECQLANGVSTRTDEHVGVVRHARESADRVVKEFGIALPPGA